MGQVNAGVVSLSSNPCPTITRVGFFLGTDLPFGQNLVSGGTASCGLGGGPYGVNQEGHPSSVTFANLDPAWVFDHVEINGVVPTAVKYYAATGQLVSDPHQSNQVEIDFILPSNTVNVLAYIILVGQPLPPGFGVAPTTLDAGGTVTISFSEAYQSGEPLQFTVTDPNGKVYAENWQLASSDPSVGFKGSFTVPTTGPAGTWTVTYLNNMAIFTVTGPTTVTTTFTVVDPAKNPVPNAQVTLI